ncbi:site-specific DNA-methyltransferase [Candidatus Weimeria sp. HCP3S3_B5]|uniref:site-specific DNA-methyltransferase n=1 Tax=Candidatus Weimeria sp. HCP3S3_B5 TaxID=3438871 RepID=UPI003F8B0347
MEKLKMHTPDLAEENYKKLAALFPDAVTETIDDDGNVVRAIDKDVLMQEINTKVVDGNEERYQFTWPDKKKSVLLANAPINKTLRPVREDETVPTGADSEGKPYFSSGSVNFDTTENLYIEGDNLEVLKLLQETYLGKIKMIYIDPPYNTGSDFVYEDDFAQSTDEYLANSGQYDEDGNRLFANTENNGRFHTDWLNMLYPRLRLSKDLLTVDGVILVSIDNNEVVNLRKMLDEVFGSDNCMGIIANINNPKGRSDDKYIATTHEYLLVYAKDVSKVEWYGFEPTEEITKRYNKVDLDGKWYREIDLRKTGENDLREDRPNLFYFFYYSEDTGDFYPDRADYIKNGYIQIKPQREDGKEGNWRWGIDTAKKQITNLAPKFMPSRKVWGVMQKDYLEGRALVKPTSSWTFKDVNSERGTEEFIELGFDKRIFPKPKPLGTIKRCLKLATSGEGIILDFFSGSATTAHAVMQMNAEDGGHRKFIMVQLPEKTGEKSEAYKAGYKNICEIGKERIRRAGKKIKEETGADIDYGFRCFKVDFSNMKDVYYRPADIGQMDLDQFTDNIKEDRTPEDLLIQVMLDLGVLLSSKIEQTEIAGKKVFSVADGYLIACFDKNVTEDVVTAIAKQKPFYAVFRDSSFGSDSVAANFEQIFATYSPQTVRKVL